MAVWIICSSFPSVGFFWISYAVVLEDRSSQLGGLALFPAPDIERRTMTVGAPPSNLPVPLAARTGQLVLSATLTDDLLSRYF